MDLYDLLDAGFWPVVFVAGCVSLVTVGLILLYGRLVTSFVISEIRNLILIQSKTNENIVLMNNNMLKELKKMNESLEQIKDNLDHPNYGA